MAQRFVTTLTKSVDLEKVKTEDLLGFSDPFNSVCPWEDGEVVKFKAVVEMAWSQTNRKGQRESGQYLAFQFEGKDTVLSFKSPIKSVTGQMFDTDGKLLDDVVAISSEGGLHDIMLSNAGLTVENIKVWVDWLKSNTTKKIKLIPYQIGRYTGHLVNVVEDKE